MARVARLRKETAKLLQKADRDARARACWAELRADLACWLGRSLPGLGLAFRDVTTAALQQMNMFNATHGHQTLGVVHILRTATMIKVGSSSMSTSENPDYTALRNRLHLRQVVRPERSHAAKLLGRA